MLAIFVCLFYVLPFQGGLCHVWIQPTKIPEHCLKWENTSGPVKENTVRNDDE